MSENEVSEVECIDVGEGRERGCRLQQRRREEDAFARNAGDDFVGGTKDDVRGQEQH